MKTSERNLWISVGIVVVVGLAINSLIGLLNSPVSSSAGNVSYEEANRLLRASQNIKARNIAVGQRLNALEAKFYPPDNIDEAQISLLKAIETIANACNLDVQQKNVLQQSEGGAIGVSLEGKTKPDTLIRFLHNTTVAPVSLRIKRLSIHGLPEQQLLSYQVVVISILIEKGK